MMFSIPTFPNAPNKKAPPAPIKRRSRCGKCNWLPFYRPYSFAPRAFARFAGCIRDIAQNTLHFFFFLMSICTNKFQKMSQKERRKIFQKETKRRKNTFPAALRQSPPGLDNPQKIYYTTNRKGAVSCKRLAPYPRIKEIDRSGWLGVRRSFPFVHFYIAIQKSSRAGRHAKKEDCRPRA